MNDVGKAYNGLFFDALEGDGQELGFAGREGGGLFGRHGIVCGLWVKLWMMVSSVSRGGSTRGFFLWEEEDVVEGEVE